MITIELFKTLWQIIMRDFYVFGKRLANYGVNYLLIFPLLNIITFGYIQPGVYFGPGHAKTSIILLIGVFAVNLLSLCFSLLCPFLYDLEADRFIDYQICLIYPRWLLFQMILFPALVASIISLPFFPLAYAILPSYFANLNLNWLALAGITFAASLCCSAYIMMSLCIIEKSSGIRRFWLRYNWPLVVLGGLWIPWHILFNYCPALGIIALADPLTYITEGIRSALIGSDQFIHYSLCIMALLGFFCIFSLVACYFFKRKMDHI